MDMNNDIESVSVEVGSNGNCNFDDIRVNMNNSFFYFQVKNILKGNPEVKNDVNQILHGGITTNYDPNCNSIYVFNAQSNPYELNALFLGHQVYKNNNLYLLNLTTDKMWNAIEEGIYINSRIEQIIRMVDSKISFGDFLISRDDLPNRVFFSNTLTEHTYKIRQSILKLDTGPIFVVGKPGVGKSHLICELDIGDKDLYRFWISESDKHRIHRLQFDSFITELSIKLFNNSGRKSIQDILSALIERDTHFFIDGIDHVERYNSYEFDKYIDFFNQLINSNAKIVLLSRPLVTNKLNLKNVIQIDLQNWNLAETILYCSCEGIDDYVIQSQIFDLTDGYPILTRYIVEEFKLTNEIPYNTTIRNITDYYNRIINPNDGMSTLKTCFISIFFY